MFPPEETQRQRADAHLEALMELFPYIASAKDGIRRHLTLAKEKSDGSLDELRQRQLDAVCKGAEDLLLALLFP